MMEVQSIWGYLPLLMRANSKESIEYILQSLWRTRKTGLDSADRHVILDILLLQNDTDLDPILVCLRILMRRCVYENVSNEQIEELFPGEVSPELRRLLTLLLQKFRDEWRQDLFKDQVIVPRLKSMTWNMVNQESEESNEGTAVINLKLQNDTRSPGETEVKFKIARDALERLVKSMSNIRDQLTDAGESSNRDSPQETNTL